ncbi:MAG TPA: pitrilysin family protein [Pyrinomonadaceae bacterium]|nr:pitrilysin family protein [Pyrinomonadaceae bacterium]
MSEAQLPAGVEFVTEADGIREYRLENRMKVLLVENRVAPVATVMVLYKVGSRNEAVGYTGSTHLLEHMMFKGTPTFNKEKNTQIAATLQKIGAAFNATTWYDRTNYFETVPSDQLELAIQLEADRMRNSFIADADRQSEMTVVRNELERGQNEPSEVLDEAVYAAAFREHPYHHPTIGWRADVEGVPTSRLKEFYDTFYHPNNATVILVGDFDEAAGLSLINKYFGAYPESSEPIPQVYTEEPQQQGERRLVVRRAGELAIVQMGFHIPGVLGQMGVLSNEELAKRAANPPEDNDIYPLVVLTVAMSHGITSRLYQALVETELAVDAHSNADQHRDPGLFTIYATVHPNIEPKKVEETILEELRKVAEEGLTEAEVEKARQQIVAQMAYSRDGTYNIAMQMSEAEAVADWRFYKDYERNIERVRTDDVRRVAQKYFTEDNRTVGYFIPKQSGGGGGSNGKGNTGGAGLVPARILLSANGQGPALQVLLERRGVQHFREPDSNDASMAARISEVAESAADGGSGGGGGQTSGPGDSTTPHEKEQQAIPERGDKSSDAAEAVTPESAGRSNFASRVVRKELATGAVLLLLENHATPTISLRGSFRAGSYFEPRNKPGLAQITANMLERGTRLRTKLQLAHDLESVGAQMAFSADPFAVSIAARALSKDLPLVIGTLAEQLREPAFPADELEKLKQQLIAVLQEQQSNTGYRARERFTQLIFDEANPYHMPGVEKLIQSIGSITVEDVKGFYSKFYGGRSLILTIAGDVQAGAVQQQFEEAFGEFAGPENVDINVTDPEPQTQTVRETVLVKEKASVDILLGSAASLRRDSADYYAAVLANSALGESTLSSRLGLRVRDQEGLTYGINSRFRAPSLAAGPWYVGVSVNPNNIEKAIGSALNVLRDYVENGIRADELSDEKSSAIGSFKVSLATNAGLAQAMWNAEFYRLGMDYIDRYPQIIQNVSVEEVNAAIRKYFRPDHLTVVIAGDIEAPPAVAAPNV